MTEADVQIVNKLGLHARPSAKVSALAGRFAAEVWLTRNGRRINAKSIMGVMMLAAARGSTLKIEADGPDEAEAVAALRALIESGFDEE
jgi:phosphocarrier protein